MPKVASEILTAARDYKRRVAGQFMLVAPVDLKAKLSGADYCVTRKIDGVMAYIVCRNGAVTMVGTGGRDMSEVPVVKTLAAAVKAAKLKSATIVAELYAPSEKGRPRVYDVLSALAEPKKASKLRLAPFDIVELNGESFKADHYKTCHAKLAEIFQDDAVRPVEMRTATSDSEVQEIYDAWVCGEGSEGLVVHSELPIVWKVKPRHTIDAVVVGFTTGELGVRDLMLAVRHEDGTYQTFGATGNGLSEERKHVLAELLTKDAVESDFIQTDSRGVAFQMVKPRLVLEVSFGDLLPENSEGKDKLNPLLEFDGKKWIPHGRVPGVAAIFLVIERERDDKTAEPSDVRVSQLTDICPFAARPAAVDLPKSTLLKRKVFKKESKGKVMLQKFVVWKTNKEADSRYPAYVFHYTDFSSGRKDPLKRDIRVSSTEAQITSIFDVFLAENVKKGWNEVN